MNRRANSIRFSLARDFPVRSRATKWPNCVFVLENCMNSNECVYKSIPWISANFLWWSWRCCAPDRIPKHQISSFNGITNDYSQSKLVSFRRLIQLSHETRIFRVVHLCDDYCRAVHFFCCRRWWKRMGAIDTVDDGNHFLHYASRYVSRCIWSTYTQSHTRITLHTKETATNK